jgi:ankyrin repeat protein
MNISNTKRGLNLAAILFGTSSMVAPSLLATDSSQVLPHEQKNAKNLMERGDFSTYGTGSLATIIQSAIDSYGGVDFSYQDENGDTLLHIFASDGDPDAVKLLLKQGANPYKRNRANKTPSVLAKEQLEIVEKDAHECTAQGKPIPNFIKKYLEKYKEIIKILMEARGTPPRRVNAGPILVNEYPAWN